LGVGLFDGVGVGVGVGVLVGLGLAVLLVVGLGLGEVDVGVGFGLVEPVLVGFADAVGSAVDDGLAEDDADELPVGVALADEEVLADVDALADLLGDRVGELVGLAELSTTSSRTADLGRVAQMPFPIGGTAWRVMEAASTSVLDARRT
jgi:hypothetical protein